MFPQDGKLYELEETLGDISDAKAHTQIEAGNSIYS